MNEARSFRENAALARRYDTPNDPVQTIASDAFPIIGISDELVDPEMHYLRGSKLCGATITDGAVAASNSHVLLINPAGSGVLAVVTQISILSAATSMTLALLFASTGAPDSTAVGLVLDSRARFDTGDAGRSQLIVGNRTIVGATVGEAVYTVNGATAAEIVTLPIRIILDPGNTLVVRSDTVQVPVQASFLWRERRLDLGEQRGA